MNPRNKTKARSKTFNNKNLKTITKFKPQILIEISSETIKNTNYEFEELLEFFEKLNYQAYSLFRGNLVKENDLKLTSWGNYIFI